MFHRRPSLHRLSHRFRFADIFELEDRTTPASTTFVGGVLTIDWTAASETITLTNTSGTIDVASTSPITGGSSFTSVSKLVLTDTGNLASQSVTFAGNALTLADGLQSTGVETVTVNAAITADGTSKIEISAPQNIVVNSSLTGGSGGVSLIGQGIAALDTKGVTVQNTAVVTATGNGPVTITGTGGRGPTERNYGVWIFGSGATITSGGGNVSVVGAGSATTTQRHFGVLVQGGTITSGSKGSVSVSGSGSTSTGGLNVGVLIDTGGIITSGGLGAVTVSGTGGTIGDSNRGVNFATSGGTITSGGGDVNVIGTGRGAALGYGVATFAASAITAGGSGKVTILGDASAATGDFSIGVNINAGTVSSNGGDITLVGIGGGIGGSVNNRGVDVFGGGNVTAGGTGAVTITGTMGGGTHSGTRGVWVSNSSAKVTSSGGPITINAIGNTIAAAFRLSDTATITTGGNAPITINADSISLENTISAGSGTVTLQTRTLGTQINLGGADVLSGSPLTLGIVQSELNAITAGTIRIGRNDAVPSGTITLNQNLTRPSATNIELATGGGINTGTAIGQFNTAGGTLTIATPVGLQPGNMGTDFTAKTVTFESGSDVKFYIEGTTVQTFYTQLSISGTVNLSGSDLVLEGTYVSTFGDTFTIVSATSVTGTFNGLPENATVTFNGQTLRANYTATGVTLTNITPPPIAVSRNGNTITFAGNNSNNALVLSMNNNGMLLHNLSGGGVASVTDIDPTTPGTQEILVADITNLAIDLGGGTDSVTFTDVSTAGSVIAESLQLNTANGGDYTLTDTSFTYNGKLMIMSGVTSVGFTCDNGDNTIDASAYTLHGFNIQGLGGNDLIRGTQFTDDLRGNDGDDVIEGNGGDDDLYGDGYGAGPSTGNDILRGGSGNDNLYADDRTQNGTGNDVLEGGDGNDQLFGGFGSDQYSGGLGIDSFFDYITGNATLTNTDYIAGGIASPNHGLEICLSLIGDDGANVIDASAWTLTGLTIHGNGGNDTLKGGSGNDDIRGHQGDDILEGGLGQNQFYGGSGSDTVRLFGTAGADVLIVDSSAVTMNGDVSSFSETENLVIDTLGGIDNGTQTPPTHPLAYTVAGLEPTISAGSNENLPTAPYAFSRGGSFLDIGSGQSWTGLVDYGAGAGFVPLVLNPDRTFTLSNTYASPGSYPVRVRITDNEGNIGEQTVTITAQAQAISWKSSTGGDWNTASNWSTNSVPTANNSVTIPNLPGQTITFSGGNVNIYSLSSGSDVKLSGGTLTINSSLEQTAGVFILYGGTLKSATVTNSSTLRLSGFNSVMSGVTIAAGATLDAATNVNGTTSTATVTNGLVLHGTAKLGNAAGSVVGELQFFDTQSITGTGTVTFGNNGSNAVYSRGLTATTAATLTVGPGISIGGGTGIVGQYWTKDSVILQGSVSVPNGRMLTINGVNWTNTGSISADAGSTLVLGGSFAPASLANLSAAGATVRLTGTVNNAGQSLDVSPSKGNWLLYGGTVAGGTITGSAGSTFGITASGGNFTGGVTIANSVTLDASVYINGNNAIATVKGGLVLNGSALLGNTAGTVSGQLTFDGTQTLSGSGSVTFGTNTFNTLYARGDGGLNPATLTVGSGVSIGGGTGLVRRYWTNDNLILNGSLSVPSGRTLSIAGANWVNAGTITAASGSTLDLGGGFTNSGLGSVSASGATVRLSGTLTNTNLNLQPSIGNWVLAGGTVAGGSIDGPSGAKFSLSASAGNFTGGVTITNTVTLDATTNIDGNNPTVNVYGGLTLNGTSILGNAAGTVYGRMQFRGTQTFSGNGVVSFGTSTSNAVYAYGDGGINPATLSVGGGVAILGGTGSIANYWPADNLNLAGTVIVPSGRTVTISGANWSNTGIINVNSGGTVVLGGGFTRTSLGTLNASGGNVYVSGTLTNTGQTLSLDPSLGNWVLYGGTIAGGTISGTAGTVVSLSASGGNFTGGVTIANTVTLNATANINGNNPAVNVFGGLTLNGNANLGNSAGTVFGRLYFKGTQSLNGSGTVSFSTSTSNGLFSYGDGGSNPTTLTVGSNIVVSGGSGLLYRYWTGDSIVLNGHVSVPTGQTVSISGANWVNTGNIQAQPGATLILGGTFTTAAIGSLNATDANVRLNGTLINSATTLNLTPELGNWILLGGTILGGTINGDSGAKLLMSSTGGTLSGVTIASNVTLDSGTYVDGSNATAIVTNGLTVHGVVKLGNTAGSMNGRLSFQGTQTFSGTGTVTFGLATGSGLFALGDGGSNPATLTIGNGINIGGGNGTLSRTYTADNLILNGTVSVPTARTLSIIGSNWVNNGTITAASGGTLGLGGAFTTAAIGTLNALGANVRVTGTLSNTSLNLSPSLGNWVLLGGTIVGGTITGTAGTKFGLSATGGTLNGVTIDTPVTLDATVFVDGASNAAVVKGGLVLNGPANLGNTAGSIIGRLEFQGTQSLQGHGTVYFGANASNTLVSRGDGGTNPATLTVDVPVRGGAGSLAGYWTADSVALVDTATAITTGTITIGGASGQAALTGITASGGGTVSISKALSLGTAPVLVATGSTFSVAGNVTASHTVPATFDVQGTLKLAGAGTAGLPQTLEVLSRDQGLKAAAFIDNFAYGSLVVGSSNYVKLVDAIDNAPGTGAEAVYVNSLNVPAGSTLDLNGLKLYTRLSQIAGTIVGGTITQIADSGTLEFNAPTPGNIAVAGELDNWTFFGYGGRKVTIIVDPAGSLAPTLQWVQVKLLTSTGTVLASAAGTVSGALLALSRVSLPSDGTYTVAVNAAPTQSSKTGSYLVAAYDSTSSVNQLSVNEIVVANVPNPYAVNDYTFAAAANTQVRLNLQTAAMSGLTFTLTGPNGYTGFLNIPGSSALVTLPSSGVYTLSSQGTVAGGFAFAMEQSGSIPLSLDAAYLGAFVGNGHPFLFEVTVPTAAPFTIALSGGNAKNNVEMYAGFGLPPTRAVHGYRAAAGATPSITIPNAAAGTWYVLVYAEAVSPGSFSLLAKTYPVVLSSITPVRYGANATVSMTLTGAGFTANSTVELINGSTVYPLTAAFDTFTQLTATGSLTGVPQGVYSVRVTKPGVGSDTLPNAFTVTAPGAGRFESQLILPGALGVKAPATFTVEYSNTGSVAIPAPLLILESKLPEDKPLLSLDSTVQVPGFWTSAVPDGFANSVQILANGAVPGLLSPGETISVPVYYAGMQEPYSNNPQFQFRLRSFEATDTSPVNWPALQASLQPSAITAAAWSPIYTGLTSQIGGTWGQYVQFLGNQANYLGRTGHAENDVSRLWNFAIQQADNAFSPVGSTLATAVDDEMAVPGNLAMSFGRVFGVTLNSRNTVGLLGTGWSTPWETKATAATDGTVTVTSTAGTQRVFQPDSRYAGVYFAQTGDAAVLRADGTGLKLTEADGSITRFLANGKLDYIGDAIGNRITAMYTTNQLTRLTHSASGQYISIAYHPAGVISTVSDSQGRSSSYTYDASFTHLVSVQGADGRTTGYAYALTGASKNALTTITRPGNTHEYFTYDATGRLSGTSRDGGVEAKTYTYAEGKTTTTDAAGSSHLYFDERGLVVKAVDALDQVAIYGYDSGSRLTSVTNALGQTQTFAYTAAGMVANTTDVLGYITRFTYGANNRLATITDANGKVTTITNTSGGQPGKTQYADGTFTSSLFDTVGNPFSVTNGNGQAIGYMYNAGGQVTKASFADGSSHTYTYTTLGQMKTATDSGGTTTFTYDPTTQQLLNVAYPDGLGLTFTYNAAGQRASVTDHTGSTTKSQYDAAGRLSGLTDGAGNPIVTYTYNPAGMLGTETFGNGASATYSYNAAGNLIRIVNTFNGSSSQYDTTWNALGLLNTETTPDGTWTYTYDADSQLIRAKLASTNVNIPNQDLTYTLDAMGNRVTTTINGVTTSYAINAVNQYTTIAGDKNTFDSNGNLTSGFTYNALNQVTATGSTTYSYNALGQRVSETTGGITTRYLNDPLGGILGIYSFAGAAISQYARGLDIAARTSATGVQYLHADVHGSVGHFSSASGVGSAPAAFDPFGSSLSTLSTEPLQYLGALGVLRSGDAYYTGSQTYQPASGRNTSRRVVAPGNNPYSVATASQRGSAVEFGKPGMILAPGLGGTTGSSVRQDAEGFSPVVLGSDIGLGDASQKAWGGAWNWIIPTVDSPNPVGGTLVVDGGAGVVASFDPNAIIGPGGYGKPNFVPVKPPRLSYAVQFENDGNATSPTQTVTITHQLDAGLDWNTFEVTSVQWADSYVRVAPGSRYVQITAPNDPKIPDGFNVVIDAGVNTTSGLVTVALRSIDPDTFLPPSVVDGFLRPEDGTGRGSGEFHYSILPKATLTTGTEIRSVAYIVFDKNAPIATDLVDVHDPSLGTDPDKQALVTIDAGLPFSSMTALPAVTNTPTFNLAWSGDDLPGGAGFRGFDVYISDNHGPYTLWVENTAETSMIFTGEAGHEYRFYTIGVDNVGQREATPTMPDAFTAIPPAPAIAAISSPSANGVYVTGQTVTIQISFTEVVTLNGGNVLLTLNSGGVATVAPFSGTQATAVYTVAAGELTPDLDVVDAVLEGGATLLDVDTNPAILGLPLVTNLASNANIIINPLSPTTVSTVTANVGEDQRSRLTRITLEFATPVLAEYLAVPGAITLTRTSGGTPVAVTTGATGPNGRITVSPASGLVDSVVLTFSNGNGAGVSNGVEYGSLADGYWQLSIPFLQYTSPLNSTSLRRLFGDTNGDGTVDGGTDFARFALGNLTANNSPFDFNNDGTIDGGTDFAEFGKRFGRTL